MELRRDRYFGFALVCQSSPAQTPTTTFVKAEWISSWFRKETWESLPGPTGDCDTRLSNVTIERFATYPGFGVLPVSIIIAVEEQKATKGTERPKTTMASMIAAFIKT